jgi:hypothetical protein
MAWDSAFKYRRTDTAEQGRTDELDEMIHLNFHEVRRQHDAVCHPPSQACGVKAQMRPMRTRPD